MAVRTGAMVAAVMTASVGLADEPRANESTRPREIEIVVDGGYEPAEIDVAPGERVILKFLRRDYSGCTKVVVFPTLGIRKALPTGEVVTIELPPLEAGEIPFHCGMKMIKGTLHVGAAP
jgi:plastocyanin domain-containing protein